MKSPRNKLPNRLILLRVGLSISTLVALLGPGAARSQAAQPAVAPGRDIILDLRTPAYQINADDVTVAGYGTIDTPGAPALPMWSTAVELPPDGNWSLDFESRGSQSLPAKGPIASVPVPDLDLNGPVAWQLRSDLPADLPTVERPDPAIYETNAFYPAEPVTAGPEQWQRGRRLLVVHAFPFQINPVTGQLRYHPDLHIVVRMTSGEPNASHLSLPAQTPAAPTDDEIDGAVRIRTTQRGVHRLTYSDLQNAGVPMTTVNPATFAMTYLNQPVDIQVTGAGDGRFDPADLVLFYAEPYQGRYMTQNVYRLTYGGLAAGPRMATRSVTPTGNEPLVTTMGQTVHVERDRDYRSVYLLSQNADHWFDTALFVTSAAPTASAIYPLDSGAPLAIAGSTATLRVALHGGADQVPTPDQSVELRLNSHVVGTYSWDGSTNFLISDTVPAAWFDATPNQITLQAALSQLPGVTYYWVSPDWVEATVTATARANDDRLSMESIPVSGLSARGHVEGFNSSAVSVYDVRDPRRPVELTTVQPAAVGSQFTIDFWDQWSASAPAPGYYLVAANAWLQPAAVEPDALSKWKSPIHRADYIAVVHASLWDAIQPLLDRRTAEGLRVKKVDVQDIYDEWSGGRVDPDAIRSFLSYAYRHWNNGEAPPRFVMLVGDGHYDFKNAATTTLPNLIPPYLIHIDPWLGETASDNRYVSVDGPDDFLPDMHVGRIPAKTPADVTAVVDKIAAYETAAGGDWQRRAIFVADRADDPAGNFWTYSDDVRLGWLPTSYEDQPIYFGMPDLQTGAQMRTAIKSALNEGALTLQWFGHASQFRWGSTSVFDLLDPQTLAANALLPFTMHFGCWSGYFIGIQGSPLYNRNEQSLGEVFLLTSGRASIADLSPSGLHVGSALQTLDRGITKAIYQDRVTRVGEAVDAGKLYFYQNGGGWYDVIDTSVLFADPALKLRLPPSDTHMLFLPRITVP